MKQAAEELAAVEAEPIDSDSDVDGPHYSPPPPVNDNVSNENSNSAQWTQIQAGDEDSRQSFVSNHDEAPTLPTGAGVKINLSKPMAFSPQNQRGDAKRRKADLREVFNPDEDDGATQIKKRKLVPIGLLTIQFSFQS